MFPRFSDKPLRAPPAAAPTGLLVSCAGRRFTIGVDELAALPQRVQQCDFHCVTTWTYQGATWGGVAMLDVWEQLMKKRAGESLGATWFATKGADRYEAFLHCDDLLAPGVLLATTLDGEPLSDRHGAPMRLVSPAQYGYKNVKHLVGFELLAGLPAGRLSAKEHPRARVHLEERHPRVPGRALRLPYRLFVAPTALISERSANTAAAAQPAQPAG